MKSGMLPKTAKQAADELIAGTDKDPTQTAHLPDSDPAGAAEDEPALAEA
jgi:hypothetical protein